MKNHYKEEKVPSQNQEASTPNHTSDSRESSKLWVLFCKSKISSKGSTSAIQTPQGKHGIGEIGSEIPFKELEPTLR